MIPTWMDKAAKKAESLFADHGIKLTIGGEPTFIPNQPDGPEWSFSAVGPTKLAYANQLADVIVRTRLPGAATFFCPGKLYPGETNPRWVVRLIANRDGSPFFQLPKRGKPVTSASAQNFAEALAAALKVPSFFAEFTDSKESGITALAMPLDHDGAQWTASKWGVPRAERRLSEAEGPAGLRLPLHLLPPEVSRRAISIEHRGDSLALFVPPLFQEPFIELLEAAQKAARKIGLTRLDLQGYTASDSAGRWTVLGLAADPGVLEINLPPCTTWREYAEWMETLSTCGAEVGLRSWKESWGDHPQGSGGGNHLLWGGPSLEEHPFFSRPAWLAAVLRFWQHHPSLAYLFTGCYVGASSQAPRPDESARDLYDIEMAYSFIESLPEGDHRGLINETLRHIHIDVTGNSHRSEISFDKFWNTSYPSGALGLIEFRAIEALPKAEWASAIALLWHCLAAHLLTAKPPKSLKRFGTRLLDEFFLPTFLWNDLKEVLDTLRSHGFALDEKVYHQIWEWRFPSLLKWKKGPARLSVRKALESWPLLCETPVEGGSTSRFVDTSMYRLEFLASPEHAERYDIYVAGRPLPLRKEHGEFLAGLRFRKTNLYPSLHPGIPTQLPLIITLVEKTSGQIAAEFELGGNDLVFQPIAKPGKAFLGESPCKPGRKGDWTFDLRLP